MNKNEYIRVEDLEVYKLSIELSDVAWNVYESLNWQEKKIMGDQFITSIDSVGANIVEGYSRFHYLDKIKFYYISRGSLSEAINHWLSLLRKRQKISEESYTHIYDLGKKLEIKLNHFIKTTFDSKKNNN